MGIDGLIQDYVNRRATRGDEAPQSAVRNETSDGLRPALSRPGASAAAAPADNALSYASQQLIKYIPAEVLTFYIPTVGYLQNATSTRDSLLWGVLGFFALISVLIVLGQAKQRLTAHGSRLGLRTMPWFPIAATILSYVAWTSSIPGSILVKALGGAAYTGPLLIIAVTILLATSTYYLSGEGAT